MNTQPSLRHPSRAQHRWGAVVVLAALAVILTLLLGQLRGEGAAAGSGTSVDAQQATPQVLAEQALRGFLTASDVAHQRADGSLAGVDRYATPGMVDEVAAGVADLRAQELSQEGRTVVVRLDLRDRSADSVEFGACIGTGAVEVVTTKGVDLLDRQDPAVRSLHLYTVELHEGTWKVSTHSFPDDPTC